jgi:hypothetical protein
VLGGGEALGVLLEALDAKQLGTDRRFNLDRFATEHDGTFLRR